MDCPKRSASAGLPEDSLVEILARVPARSVYRSKCVAKAWRDLIEDPLHRKKLPQTLQGFFFIHKETLRRRVGFTNLLARSVPLQIDPSLSFLKKLPGIGTLSFLDSCNGLLLFEHKKKPRPYGYVVCNPATKQWVEVPRYGPPDPEYARFPDRYNYLVFDPTVSSHFHMVQFGWEFAESVKIEEEEFMVDGDGDEDGDGDDEGNDDYVPDHWKHAGYVPDYWELRHQQRYNPNIYIPDYIRSDDDNDRDEENEDDDGEESRTSVQVYSSETGKWTHMQSDWSPIQSDWDKHDLEGWWRLQGSVLESSCCAVLNSMLHFTILDQIVVVDVQGVTRKTITVPKMAERSHRPNRGYVAQSQGRLHYINQASDAELSIWVLENYDTQDWVLKHTVSFMELFRKKSCTVDKNHYSVVAMHPDGNVVFIVQNWNGKLMSYDMDHKLVSIIRTLKNDASDMHVVPYVPCFSESPALPNKH